MDINYDFYTEHFGGDILSADLFPSYAQKALMYLNSITFNQAGKNIDSNIGCAICDIAELYYKEDKTGGITHETVDGYSVTRSYDETFNERLSSTAQLYLSCSGLLYRGGVYGI